MSKLAKAARGAAGVFEALRDLAGIYGANSLDADTVAFVSVAANELAVLDSTTTPLGNAAVYQTGGATETFVQTQGFGRVVGTVFADQAGTLNIDWSSDGKNVDYTDTVAVAAAAKTKFSFETVAPYAAVRYVNGATPSTVMRLYAWLRRGN